MLEKSPILWNGISLLRRLKTPSGLKDQTRCISSQKGNPMSHFYISWAGKTCRLGSVSGINYQVLLIFLVWIIWFEYQIPLEKIFVISGIKVKIFLAFGCGNKWFVSSLNEAENNFQDSICGMYKFCLLIRNHCSNNYSLCSYRSF